MANENVIYVSLEESVMKVEEDYDFILAGIDEEEHMVHRSVLSAHSDHFRDTILAHDNKENIEGKYTLSKEIDRYNQIGNLIDFMYTGKIVLTPEKIIYILKMADFFQMSELVTILKASITQTFEKLSYEQDKDAVAFEIFRAGIDVKYEEYKEKSLDIAVEDFMRYRTRWDMRGIHENFFLELFFRLDDFSHEDKISIINMFLCDNKECNPSFKTVIVNYVTKVLEKTSVNLSKLKAENVHCLPSPLILALLTSENLIIKCEYDIYQFITSLVEQLGDSNKTVEDIDSLQKELFSSLRLQFFDKYQIQTILNGEYAKFIHSDILLAHLLKRDGLKVPQVDTATSVSLQNRGETKNVLKITHIELCYSRNPSSNLKFFRICMWIAHANVIGYCLTSEKKTVVFKANGLQTYTVSCSAIRLDWPFLWNKSTNLIIEIARICDHENLTGDNCDDCGLLFSEYKENPRTLILNSEKPLDDNYTHYHNYHGCVRGRRSELHAAEIGGQMRNDIPVLRLHGNYNGQNVIFSVLSNHTSLLSMGPTIPKHNFCMSISQFKWSDFHISHVNENYW